MILLPVPWEGKVKLLVVLEDDNLERIKEHDCAEVIWRQLGSKYADRVPDSITIGYASADEMKLFLEYAATGNTVEAIKLATGGFRYRPERGDHDFGPVLLSPKSRA